MDTLSLPTLGGKRTRRGLQAGNMRNAYVADVRLMQAIGEAARMARKDAGVRQVRIAAAIGDEGVDQSTISRFEGGGGPEGGQPRDLEQYLLTYQEETGYSVVAILRNACDRYEAEPPTPAELAEVLGSPTPNTHP